MDADSEARWTPPSDWCPDPQWWHADSEDADGAEYEVADLVRALVRALQPEIAVETGTATGKTARMIGEALARNRHGHLHTVEIDKDAAWRAMEAVDGLPVSVYCTDTLQWDPPSPVDFAWIDSGAANVRVEEVWRWREKFRRGAVVGVHDTAPTMGRDATMHAMARVFRDLGWPVLNLRTPRGVMLAQVTDGAW